MIGKKIEICKDWENATLMLYRYICNIWRKNIIQILYKNQNSRYAIRLFKNIWIHIISSTNYSFLLYIKR